MEKKLQVFISSTYIDLIEERQKVVEAVLNAGHIPAGMELFKAGPSQETIIKEWIEASDVYALILGGRYGSLNEDGISYTQWEYELAKDLDKPMFSIVLQDDYINRLVEEKRIKATDLEMANVKYIDFKKKVQECLNVQITHIEQFRSGVSDSLQAIEKRFEGQLEGWIPGRYLTELEKLRSENKELSENLTSYQFEVTENQKGIRPISLKRYYEIIKLSQMEIDESKEKDIIFINQFIDILTELDVDVRRYLYTIFSKAKKNEKKYNYYEVLSSYIESIVLLDKVKQMEYYDILEYFDLVTWSEGIFNISYSDDRGLDLFDILIEVTQGDDDMLKRIIVDMDFSCFD